MKFDRAAFLYLEPKASSYGPPKAYAQCGTCIMWTGPDDQRCTIHGPNVHQVTWDTTCGFYVNGQPHVGAKTVKLVTTKESGAEKRQVRCENCYFYKPSTSKCLLFVGLNKVLKGLAKLKERVHPYGCCNANIKR